MRLLSAAVCTTVAAALLASCSGNSSSPSSSMVPGSGVGAQGKHHTLAMVNLPKSVVAMTRDGKLHGKQAPSSAIKGSWASGFFGVDVLGYPKNNSANGAPTCELGDDGSVNGFGVDTKGDVIIPDAFNGVEVYSAGCGSLLGTITDIYGQAADAAAIDAVNGTIVVGHVGTVATCSLSSLTCTELNSPGMSGFASVAMDKSGNCYAQAGNTQGVITLWYYAGCTGTGTNPTGFNEPGSFDGGMDVDNKGNLVVINQENSNDSVSGNATVYSGCNTGACTVVAGPTTLTPNGSGVDIDYCRLGRQNERLICGDASFSQVDVFTYLPSREPSYLYSFNNSMSSVDVEAAAYSPSSQGK
jgi:hypothetical protein